MDEPALSSDDLDSFLSEIGLGRDSPPKSHTPLPEESVEELLSEVYELTELEREESLPVEEPPFIESPSIKKISIPLWPTLILWGVFCCGFLCGLPVTFKSTPLEHAVTDLTSIVDELHALTRPERELSEERLLQDLTPPFPEDEIIEPSAPPEFSIA